MIVLARQLTARNVNPDKMQRSKFEPITTENKLLVLLELCAAQTSLADGTIKLTLLIHGWYNILLKMIEEYCICKLFPGIGHMQVKYYIL